MKQSITDNSDWTVNIKISNQMTGLNLKLTNIFFKLRFLLKIFYIAHCNIESNGKQFIHNPYK